MKDKFAILVVIVIVVLLSGIFISRSNPKTTPPTLPTISVEKKVTLEINYGDKKENFDYKFEGEKTVLDILNEITSDKNIGLETKVYDFGTMVESIGNVKKTDKRYWIYKLNGEAGTIAADKQVVNDSDIVTWELSN